MTVAENVSALRARLTAWLSARYDTHLEEFTMLWEPMWPLARLEDAGIDSWLAVEVAKSPLLGTMRHEPSHCSAMIPLAADVDELRAVARGEALEAIAVRLAEAGPPNGWWPDGIDRPDWNRPGENVWKASQ